PEPYFQIDSGGPWSVSWRFQVSGVPSTYTCDRFSYKGVDYPDNDGDCIVDIPNITQNSSLSIFLKVADTTPPTCTGPTYSPGSAVNGTITGTSTASDANGIARTGVYVFQGNTHIKTIQDNNTVNSATSLSKAWDLKNDAGNVVANGTYQMHFNWYDASNNMKQCKADFTIDKTAPTSSFTSGPTQVCLNSTQTYSIKANDNNNLDIAYYTYSPTTSQSWKTPKPLDITDISGNVGVGSTAVVFSTANGFIKGSSYYFASGATDDAGNKCSGNQFINTWPSGGWYFCGWGARKIVNVVGSPNAPTLNTVSRGVLNRINLRWTDNSNDEVNFTVYRNGSFLTTLGTNSTSFSDTTAICDGRNYNYQVFANNVYTCGGNGSAVLSGNCKVDNPTTCGDWTLSPSSPSNTNSVAVTARASDSDGIKSVSIFGYGQAPNYNSFIYNPKSATANYSWNTSSLATGVYEINASWKDTNNISTTCKVNYPIDKTPPSVPGTIISSPTCAGVSGISWGASTDSGAVVSGLSHYVLSIDQDNNGSIDFTKNVTSTSYNTYNFLKGKTYKIWVHAIDNVGNWSGANSKTITIQSDPAKPNLTATVDGNRNVSLSWPALGYGSGSYTVSSGTDISCDSSTCTSTVPAVSCGNHSYTVTLTNSCGYTATSGSASVTAGAFVAKPVVTATRMSQTDRVTLSWGNDANATSYTINGTGTRSTPSCSGSICSSEITGLSCSTTYSYTVKATNACGSGFDQTSNSVSIKPNCAPSCTITGGDSGPYDLGVKVSLGSTYTDESTVSYLWGASVGSVPNPSTGSSVTYTTANANNAYPEVRLTVTDEYNASYTCFKRVGTKGVKGTQTLASGIIDRLVTYNVLLKYEVKNYNNKDESGNSIDATATINKSGTSMCNSVASCVWTDSAGKNPQSGNSITIASGNTTAYVLVTLKNPNNLSAGAYTFPVDFISSVGNTKSIATVTVSNRAPTCTISGIDETVLYNRNQVIPITLTIADADGDTLTRSVSASTSCGSVSALTNANKADFTTPNINNAYCVVKGTVSDGIDATNCYVVAKTKAQDITFSFTPVDDVNRTPAPTISIAFDVTMENDQDGDGLLAIASDPVVSIPAGGFANLCDVSGVICTINNTSLINGTNSKSISVQVTVPKNVNPSIFYAVKVNASATSTLIDADGNITTTTLTGTGGTTVKFNNALPSCTGISYSPSAVYQSKFQLGRDISLTGQASDPDGDDIVSYSWELPSGQTGSTTTQSTVYRTKEQFNTTETVKYYAYDTYGASCNFTNSAIGTESATQISGRVFEVQAVASQTDTDICNAIVGNGESNQGINNVKLADTTYGAYPVANVNTNSSGQIGSLSLKVDSTTYDAEGNARFVISNLPDGFVLLNNNCTKGFSGTVSKSGNSFTLSGVKRNTAFSVNIPVKFYPNPYIVTQQGDIFSGASTTPVLQKPVLANVSRLISDGGKIGTGILLSGATNHSGVSWTDGNVDFTSKQGIFGQTLVNNNFAEKFTGEAGIFKTIDNLINKGQLGGDIKYETGTITISNTNYDNYANKITVVNGGDVILDMDSLIGKTQLDLFILATGKITVRQTTSASVKTLIIKGALISGITASDNGILDLKYGIKVSNSTQPEYKNPSIQMIFDPSFYLNNDINGVKVLNYKVREISD
ncbi:MAG: Ig-like domain-containing protein, partial [bacterium]|nr:Ig-like domain-containing protein [bacterium]